MTRLYGQAQIASLPLLIVALALVGVWIAASQAREAASQTEASDARLFTFEMLELRLVDSETGIRGYAATRDPRFLEPYTAAVSAIPALIADLNQAPIGGATRDQLPGVAAAAAYQLRLLDQIRIMVASGRVASRTALLRRGKTSMDALRTMIAQYQDGERRLNAARRARFATAKTTLAYALGATFLLAIAGGVAFIFFFTNRIVKRLASVIVKTEQVAAGEELGAPLDGNDEIAEVDRAVHRMAATIRARNAGVARYGMLATYARDGILFIDRDTLRVVEANQSAMSAYGYGADEFQTLTLADICIPSERAGVTARCDAADGVSDTLIETVALRKDGSSFPVEIAAQSGEVGGRATILEVVRDVTERRRTDAALLDTNVALNARNDELNAVNAELESFSYSVSHDLRSPIRAILGYARVLEKDYGTCLDAKGQRVLGVIRSEAKRMGQLIDDLLAFSRLGSQRMQTATVDMMQLVGEIVESERRTDEGGTTIDVERLPPARCDR
jgi:PAS domain S-box-containing protein